MTRKTRPVSLNEIKLVGDLIINAPHGNSDHTAINFTLKLYVEQTAKPQPFTITRKLRPDQKKFATATIGNTLYNNESVDELHT